MVEYFVGAGLAVCGLLFASHLRTGDEELGGIWIRRWLTVVLIVFIAGAVARLMNGTGAILAALLSSTALVSVFPLQYLHARALVGAPSPRPLLHLAVPVSNVALVYAASHYAAISGESGVLLAEGATTRGLVLTTLIVGFLIAFYPVTALRMLKSERRNLRESYGLAGDRLVGWARLWSASQLLMLASAIGLDIIELTVPIEGELAARVTYAVLVIQVLYVGYSLGTLPGLPPLERDSPTKSGSIGDPWTAKELADGMRLTEYMRVERPYLDAGTTQEMLRRSLGWTSNRLTRAIRVNDARHFNDYLNGWRVAEAERLIDSHPDQSLLTLAMDAGFGSKTAFNTAFKRHRGISPTAFRKRLRSGVG